MKKFVLLFVLACPVFAQEPPKPTLPPSMLSEHQTDLIKLALKDFQIAQLLQSQAEQNVNSASAEVASLVEKTRAELKLDDTWTFDYKNLLFVKKPEVKK